MASATGSSSLKSSVSVSRRRIDLCLSADPDTCISLAAHRLNVSASIESFTSSVANGPKKKTVSFVKRSPSMDKIGKLVRTPSCSP